MLRLKRIDLKSHSAHSPPSNRTLEPECWETQAPVETCSGSHKSERGPEFRSPGSSPVAVEGGVHRFTNEHLTIGRQGATASSCHFSEGRKVVVLAPCYS